MKSNREPAPAVVVKLVRPMEVVFVSELFDRLNNVLFRQQALTWVAEGKSCVSVGISEADRGRGDGKRTANWLPWGP